MNRIVLIGNGFDLAHGLKTSYQHFLNAYWQEWFEKLHKCEDCKLSDELYEFIIKRDDELAEGTTIKRLTYLLNMYLAETRTLQQTIDGDHLEDKTFASLSQYCDLVNEHTTKISGRKEELCHQAISQLFNEINNAYLTNWVDIENEYYRFLKVIHDSLISGQEVTADMLNTDLNRLKDKLISYLSIIQEEKITSDLVNKDIAHEILAPFDLRDISNGGRDLFLDYIFLMISELPNGMCLGEIEELMRNHPEYSIMNTKEEAYREMVIDLIGEGKLDDYIFPNRTLLLNFNYTNTAEKLYSQSAADDWKCESIHIHGELKNPNNPIIFGYGDEMDEHYKKIVDLNDNDYLQNIKSIRYLETDNYRKLVSFINSAPYQIYIMGHSCGNSDRTLLNTLFEHKNCISIKPYYYQKADETDNYIDIIQNIHRNFKDMTLMRDRVVNKKYCKPLPQNTVK